MNVTHYKKDDAQTIKQIFIDAFSEGSKEEGELIGNLVMEMMEDENKEDVLGFTALNEGKLVASIFFSRISFERSINAFILSPVAVHPNVQKRGIGKELIRFGISELKSQGVSLLLTYGDPKYYCQFGFQNILEEDIQAPYKLSQPIGWLGQMLSGKALSSGLGASRCVRALMREEIW